MFCDETEGKEPYYGRMACNCMKSSINQRIYYNYENKKAIQMANFAQIISNFKNSHSLVCQSHLSFFYLCNVIYMRRRNLMRIHRPRHGHLPTEPISSSFSMSEPGVDDVKHYLANLHEEESGKNSKLSNSLSFDLTLAEWKSHSQLVQTAPAESRHLRKQILIYAEHPDTIPESPPEHISISHSPPTKKSSPYQNKNKNLFFKFNKSAISKGKTHSQLQQSEGFKNWIKPTLYTLSDEVRTPKQKSIKQIRLNFPTPKRNDQPEGSIHQEMERSHSQLWPFHGIHQNRNKFELILNSRRQRAIKSIKISAIRPEPMIKIFSRRLE